LQPVAQQLGPAGRWLSLQRHNDLQSRHGPQQRHPRRGRSLATSCCHSCGLPLMCSPCPAAWPWARCSRCPRSWRRCESGNPGWGATAAVGSPTSSVVPLCWLAARYAFSRKAPQANNNPGMRHGFVHITYERLCESTHNGHHPSAAAPPTSNGCRSSLKTRGRLRRSRCGPQRGWRCSLRTRVHVCKFLVPVIAACAIMSRRLHAT
jgi:hypothetical protein